MFNFFDKKDSKIQEDVMSELKWDPSVTATHLNASSNDGIVTLRGTVPHFYEKSNAEEAAQRVGGVRAVADEIEVSFADPYVKSDEDLAAAALNALTWSYSAPKDTKVLVAKGWITLSGKADWNYQRSAAKKCVGQLLGVRGVTNNITIRSQPLPSDVKSHIEEALKRSAEAEGRKITVTVSGENVTLNGSVHSFSEVNDAEVAAWNAPGVVHVENNLKISQ